MNRQNIKQTKYQWTLVVELRLLEENEGGKRDVVIWEEVTLKLKNIKCRCLITKK